MADGITVMLWDASREQYGVLLPGNENPGLQEVVIPDPDDLAALRRDADMWRRVETAIEGQLGRLSKWSSSAVHAAQIQALEWVLAVAEQTEESEDD